MPATERDPDGWSTSDKFTVVLERAGLNATELSAYCGERGLYTVLLERWRQAATDANEKPVLTLKEQKELERLRAQEQREIKRLKKELTRKDKALAEAAAMLLVTKKMQALWGEVEEGHTDRCAERLSTPRLIAGGRWRSCIEQWRLAQPLSAWLIAWVLPCVHCSAGGVSSRVIGTVWIAVKAAIAWFLTASQKRSAPKFCAPAISLSTRRYHQGRSFLTWQTREPIWHLRAAFTGCSMPTAWPTALGGPGRLRSPLTCHV